MVVYFSKLGNLGKIGNALFQIACTIATAKRNNDVFQFPSSWERERHGSPEYRANLNLPESCFVTGIRPKLTYNEPHFHYTPIPYSAQMDLVGYFQSENYFKDFEQDIRQFLYPKYNSPAKPGVASIHVRRGDYVTLPNHHPVLTMDYYEEAMQLVNVNNFIVFSDDIPWCKQHFIGNRFEFSEGNCSLLDIFLQSKCEHNIIANSSLSWWGAWFNTNPNKTVIAPKRWFGRELAMHNTKDLLPSFWKKI